MKKPSKRVASKRLTIGFYEDEVAIIEQNEGKTFSGKIHTTIRENPKLKKRIEKKDAQIRKLKEQLTLQHQRKEINGSLEKVEAQKGKINTTSKPRLSPMEREKRYLSCHMNLRMYEENLDIFFCGKGIKLPSSERKITNAKVTPERCKQCIDIHQKQQRLNALIREKKSDRYSGKPRIDWGKAEAYPNDGWF